MSDQLPTFNFIDALLQKKGYGLTDAQGNIINIDNWARNNGGNPYWQNGQKVHWEDFYIPQDRAAFSPLPLNPVSIEGFALLLLAAQFAKTPEGQKSLERIINKYLDSCARIVESVQDACHSNWLTALNNQHITAAISHKIGLIDDGGYLKVMDHYRAVFDKMFAIAVVTETITGVTTLVQGAKTYNQASTQDKSLGFSTSDMTSASGIAALTNILKGAIP